MPCRRLRQQRLDSKDVHGPYFVKNLTVPSRHSKAVGARVGGLPWHPPMLTNQFILSQTKGQIMATTLITCPSGLPDLPTALHNKSGAVKEAICYIV